MKNRKSRQSRKINLIRCWIMWWRCSWGQCVIFWTILKVLCLTVCNFNFYIGVSTVTQFIPHIQITERQEGKYIYFFSFSLTFYTLRHIPSIVFCIIHQTFQIIWPVTSYSLVSFILVSFHLLTTMHQDKKNTVHFSILLYIPQIDVCSVFHRLRYWVNKWTIKCCNGLTLLQHTRINLDKYY